VTRKKRVVVGCLSIVGLILAVMGALAVLNWDAVFRHLGETLDVQTERTRTTLFRLGEVMSIGAELRSEYGTEPDVTYNTSNESRVLGITLGNYQLPEEVTAKDHAREIAVFAIGRTKKFKEIDMVEVRFETSAGGLELFGFTLDELMSARQADFPKPEDSP
jgi:hypothetical protein